VPFAEQPVSDHSGVAALCILKQSQPFTGVVMMRKTLCTFLALAGVGAVAAGTRHDAGDLITPVEARAADERGDSHRCTLRSLRGAYGVLATGTVITAPPAVPVGPFATVGRMVIDGEGNAVFNATRSFNGTILPEVDLPGTLTIDEGCQGSALFNGGRQFDFVVVDGGREMYWIQTNPGAAVTVTLKRQ
jgi:hypothetical protein